MFDIGFPELLLVSVVVLLVFGPERLPEVLRSVGRFVGGARRSFASLRAELEREVGADEIRRDLHNARIMDEVNRIGDSVRAGRDEVEELLGKRYAALEAEGLVEDKPATTSAGDAASAGPAEQPATEASDSGAEPVASGAAPGEAPSIPASDASSGQGSEAAPARAEEGPTDGDARS